MRRRVQRTPEPNQRKTTSAAPQSRTATADATVTSFQSGGGWSTGSLNSSPTSLGSVFQRSIVQSSAFVFVTAALRLNGRTFQIQRQPAASDFHWKPTRQTVRPGGFQDACVGKAYT